MPAKSKAPPKIAQAKSAEQIARAKQQKMEAAYFAKLRKDQTRERDRQLVAVLKAAKGKGIYDPKSFKLTKYRKTQARKIQKTFGEFLDPTKYFFVKPEKAQQKKFTERGKSLTMKTTKEGVFIAKEGHTKAKAKYDKKRDELYIERSGKTKRGPRKGVKYRSITPMADVDTLDRERDRLGHMASKFGKLNRDERLTFKVIENGVDGYSKRSFSNIDLLMNYLDSYKKSLAGKTQFFRHIIIEKTTAKDHFEFIQARQAAKDATRPSKRVKKL